MLNVQKPSRLLTKHDVFVPEVAVTKSCFAHALHASSWVKPDRTDARLTIAFSKSKAESKLLLATISYTLVQAWYLVKHMT